jgi:hypothetical protein
MAMPLYEGGTLKQALRARAAASNETPDENWLRRLLVPLLDALELLHRADCLHRDISPDNILLVGGDRSDVQPLLLDFGAARRVIGEQTQALTVILKPGFAPIEQYDEIPGMKQGPWTDLYALAAVVHFAITGRAPAPSVGRLVHDAHEPLAETARGRYSEAFLAAIDRALAPRPADRPQSVGEFRRMLSGNPPAASPAATAAASRPKTVAGAPIATRSPRWGRSIAWGAGVGLAAIVVAGLTLNFMRHRQESALAESSKALAHPPRPTQDGAMPAASAVSPAPVQSKPAEESPSDSPAASPVPASQPVQDSANKPVPRAIDRVALVPSKGAAPVRRAPPSKPAPTEPSGTGVAPTRVDPAPDRAVPSARMRRVLRESRDCLVARDYACTIQRAEEVLKVEPDNVAAQRLLKLARAGQEGALSSDWKMR